MDATLCPSAPANLLDERRGQRAAAWWRPTGSDLVFLVAVLLVVQTARQTMLDDPGLGWHLRNIDAMVQYRGWLDSDPFTLSPDGQARAWRTNQWLGELPLWLGWKWAGLEGIAAAATLVLAFLFRCVYRVLLADGLPWPVAAAWTAVAAMGTSCSWAARPNLFTLLFMLITARVCARLHSGAVSRKQSLWLLVLFAVWANVHGGFVAGLLTLGASLAIELGVALFALTADARQAARGRAAHLVLLTGGAVLATLVNPYGWSLYPWVFQLLGNPYFMGLHQEWQSPDFHGRGAMRFEALILLLPLLLGLTRRRPNVVELVLSVLWLHLALGGFRYVAIWVVVTVPMLARASAGVPWFVALGERLRKREPDSALFQIGQGPSRWLATAAVAVTLLVWAKAAQGRFAVHKPELIPAETLDRVLTLSRDWETRHGRPAVLFHNYNWGGYLTWHGWPAVRNWIDDRNEVQGEAHVRDYFTLVNAEPGWKDKLFGVDLVALQPDAPLTRQLAEAGAWRELYRDDWAVIFDCQPTAR